MEIQRQTDQVTYQMAVNSQCEESVLEILEVTEDADLEAAEEVPSDDDSSMS
jgi:hypothetical protein